MTEMVTVQDTQPSRGALTTRMNPDVKAAWLKALKSGKYKQGKHVLAHTTTAGSMLHTAPVEEQTYHCCLGVLAELAVEAGIVERLTENGATRYGTPWNFDYQYSTLPAAVTDWAGFNGQCKYNPDVVVVDWRDGNADIQRSVSLAEINDETGVGQRATQRKVSLYKGDYAEVIPWIEAL